MATLTKEQKITKAKQLKSILEKLTGKVVTLVKEEKKEAKKVELTKEQKIVKAKSLKEQLEKLTGKRVTLIKEESNDIEDKIIALYDKDVVNVVTDIKNKILKGIDIKELTRSIDYLLKGALDFKKHIVKVQI